KSYEEGKEYSKLSTAQATQTGDKIEVLEFFWYGCPHCFHLEPALQKWLKNKPENVHFIRVPAPLNPSWMVHTKAYYALELMGVGEKYHHDLFSAIHTQRKRIFDQDSIAAYLKELGVDMTAYNNAYNSFAVEMRTRKAMQLGQNYQLHGVPMLTVNGKYVISADTAGGYDGMINVTNFLIQKEAASR
ncbi:MAG: thiol:disulfide interchange protein DsbA/DsbL, partial [Gammaproteobacteria bacterium]|nr:thiol:disulfide interchange protein DsbA/DsbL [Gammaproteobacteria bacterium]